ncbi:MAG: triose-phosphate isomerase, partial [Cyclobacteriaceae bacterium]|nr:triose-phosphate isomerase [Cyclobacteriaceae bacterium]
MRKKIVAGNWKMNLSLEEGQRLTSEILHQYANVINKQVSVVLNPPFPHLYPVKNLI